MVDLFWQEFSLTFSTLMQKETTDQNFQNSIYQQWYLQQLWQDTLGYAGCELIRRTLGWAESEALKQLEDRNFKLQVQHQLLVLGQHLIMQRKQMTFPELLLKLAE